MASANPAIPNKKPVNNKSSKSDGPMPPEEEFWKRYSPHHEFPLSTVSSVAIHILALVLIAVVGYWLLGPDNKRSPLKEIGIVVVGGGGGNPNAAGVGPGGELANPVENVGNENIEAPKNPDNKREQLKAALPPMDAMPDTKDESARQLIQAAGEAVQAQSRINRDAQEKLRRSVGYGQGGPGRDGGRDRGQDTGKGSDKGAGDGSKRYERTLRWVMVFDTYNGDDYANQLNGLGAILAIPRKDNQYLIVRDLRKRPAALLEEDIEKIKRIYWVDDKRESITPLCMALGINPVPDHVVAFFPEKLEGQLLSLELKYKGLKEHEIYETRFKVRKTAGGYEPVVVDQKAK
jgi:hypothetical protein